MPRMRLLRKTAQKLTLSVRKMIEPWIGPNPPVLSNQKYKGKPREEASYLQIITYVKRDYINRLFQMVYVTNG